MPSLSQISSWYLLTAKWGLFQMWEHEPSDSKLSARIGSSRDPQGSSRGGSNVPPSTHDKARGQGISGQQRRSIESETVNRPTTTVPT